MSTNSSKSFLINILCFVNHKILKYKPCLPRAIITFLLLTTTSCDQIGRRLNEVGQVPRLSQVRFAGDSNNDNILESERRCRMEAKVKTQTNYEKAATEPSTTSPNSLWSGNGKAFFSGYAPGDIISVKVSLKDRAQFDNKTQKSRQSNMGIGLPHLFGLEKPINDILPSGSNAANLVKTNSNSNSAGNGKIDRKEVLETVIAAMVIKSLGNGNLLIKGSQEIRVNFELREITVEGIVRPGDIASDNTIKLAQIAEARVSYGGRGQIFEFQQDQYGKQILDIISPF